MPPMIAKTPGRRRVIGNRHGEGGRNFLPCFIGRVLSGKRKVEDTATQHCVLRMMRV
jgi:hypothetical protein